jgi:hypothetical protein
MGGESKDTVTKGFDTWWAAMEPAANGRGKLLAHVIPAQVPVAAMEPAANGRGKWSRNGRDRAHRKAAMEPAANGRGK